jgi:AICAR transformylase/IMP cyclohydrolase PurH (only IMP cyclohydrolase domain in Aful)
MRSTGEVMGIDPDPGLALGKSFSAAGTSLPIEGLVFISVRNDDKNMAVWVARRLHELGLELLATPGTANCLKDNGLEVESVQKIFDDPRNNILDYLRNGRVKLVINTTSGQHTQTVRDTKNIRLTAILCKVPIVTTMAGAEAVIEAIASLKKSGIKVRSLQNYYNDLNREDRSEGAPDQGIKP